MPLDELALAPGDALRALAAAGEPWPFALTGDWAGGGAIVGARPLRVAGPDEDPFALLDEQPAVEAAHVPQEMVGGGWFGWLGYGLGARVERLAPPPPRPVPLPPFQLAFYDHLLRRDPHGRWWFEALATRERTAALEARCAQLRALLASAEEAADGGAATAGSRQTAHGGSLAAGSRQTAHGGSLAAGSRPAARGEHRAGAPRGPAFRIAGPGAAGHRAAVAACRERIAAGEVFQANVCLRLEADWDGDLAELFALAAERLEPARGAAFPAPWGGIASLSPELFLRRRGRAVESAPIKGTVARDGDAADVAAARAALLRSAKDGAEHTMIVDLMRNDLGRVCAYGSVEAEPAPAAEPHPGVWHLVTRVRGRLRADAGDGALLRATFPPGSVTGAPKVQALHVIGELESSAREAYTGAIGFASPLAGLELSVAIRTFEARDGRLWLGAGGGVVADSDPERELEECLVKARPLVEAIGGRIEEPRAARAAQGTRPGGGPRGAQPVSGGRAAQRTHPGGAHRDAQPVSGGRAGISPALVPGRRRPDPRAGVFETLRVRDGEAPRADAHLARLAASVAVLYDATLPDDLADRVADAAAASATGALRVADAAAASATGALRVHARPDGRGAVAVAVGPGAERVRTAPVRLVPFTLPGGLGAHKWHDRRLLDALAREAAGATPLLLDGDGAVLEAAWASVFVLEGERLTTPPADGRLLPGVTRAALLDAAEAYGLAPAEAPLTLERLVRADAILVTSALAGAVQATVEGHLGDIGALALVRDLTRSAQSPALPANA
jgi:anthranilate/para-aminobenzoate synthase component I/branched-subunit amino acid aminotransferase/4-amino-4-deoxychorismate lyase